MRVCLLYDRLFPLTLGGAERWYRNLAEHLAAAGHEVTYVTLRHWDAGVVAEIPGVEVVVVGPKMDAYEGDSGRRRILPTLVYGVLVLAHLVRHGGRYDVVHTASFPYFSLLAAAVARPLRGFRVVVDWHEVWSLAYWRSYLGRAGGTIGFGVQALCTRVPQRAFCFSRLHRDRLREEGLRGEPTLLEGEYAGALEEPAPGPAEPLVVFAGRHIPEKRAPAVVAAVVEARRAIPELRAVIFGDGPEHGRVRAEIERAGATGFVDAPGFVASAEVDDALGRALCLLLPSSREGYGLVVVESVARGVPAIVVAGPDNAATELVEDGFNGFVAPSASPPDLARAIVRAWEGGDDLRRSTARWFGANARRLSLEHSLETVLEAYAAKR